MTVSGVKINADGKRLLDTRGRLLMGASSENCCCSSEECPPCIHCFDNLDSFCVPPYLSILVNGLCKCFCWGVDGGAPVVGVIFSRNTSFQNAYTELNGKCFLGYHVPEPYYENVCHWYFYPDGRENYLCCYTPQTVGGAVSKAGVYGRIELRRLSDSEPIQLRVKIEGVLVIGNAADPPSFQFARIFESDWTDIPEGWVDECGKVQFPFSLSNTLVCDPDATREGDFLGNAISAQGGYVVLDDPNVCIEIPDDADCEPMSSSCVRPSSSADSSSAASSSAASSSAASSSAASSSAASSSAQSSADQSSADSSSAASSADLSSAQSSSAASSSAASSSAASSSNESSSSSMTTICRPCNFGDIPALGYAVVLPVWDPPDCGDNSGGYTLECTPGYSNPFIPEGGVTWVYEDDDILMIAYSSTVDGSCSVDQWFLDIWQKIIVGGEPALNTVWSGSKISGSATTPQGVYQWSSHCAEFTDTLELTAG